MINLIETLIGPSPEHPEVNDTYNMAIARVEGLRLSVEGVAEAVHDMYPPSDQIIDRIHHITDKSDVLASGVVMKRDKSVREFLPIETASTPLIPTDQDKIELHSSDHVNHEMLDEMTQQVVMSREARDEIDRINGPNYVPAAIHETVTPKHIDRYEMTESDPMATQAGNEESRTALSEIRSKLDAIYDDGKAENEQFALAA